MMVDSKSLINGIGNHKKTNQYYDDWSSSYDETLSKWNYKAPLKASLILKSFIKSNPKKILDLACGTGLFGEQLLKIFPSSSLVGVDNSKKILEKAKSKKIYKKLICSNFNDTLLLKGKYNIVSCIGAMTYCSDPKKLISEIYNLMADQGFFIFTHRLDLWKKQDYNKLINKISDKWKLIFISKPLLYLPNNKDFGNKIKIKVALLRKV